MKKNTSNLILILLCFSFDSEGSIVNTNYGKISGKILNTLKNEVEFYGFMGIPFAKPPVGDLRFLPPQPIQPWDGILIADNEKPACVQFNHNIPKQQPFGVYGKEDCLYLDVFTPTIPDESKEKNPVIVFLYNEQFRNSYNKSEHYGPDFFIEEKVIVVTVSHRISVFGFLSLEDDTLPGNSGLKDIVLALEWVKDNIEFFGGDNTRITLLGAQGGGAAVDLLLHSSAKHLFHAAIIQSGTSWTSQYLQENVRDRAIKLSELLDRKSSCSANILKGLNEFSVNDLLLKEWDANPIDYYSEYQRNMLTFGPIVEKSKNGLINSYPENQSTSIDIPIMVGFNSREGIEPALQYLIEPRYLTYVEQSFGLNMPIRLNYRFDPESEKYEEAIKQIKTFYFPDGKVTTNNVAEFVTYFGDVINMYGIDYGVRSYAKTSSNKIFYYLFDYVSELNENKNNLLKLTTVKKGLWGSAMGDELCYLFKCPKLSTKYNSLEPSAITVQRKMIRMWANFAKYGTPTGKKDDLVGKINWKPYTSTENYYLKIDEEMQLKKNLLSGRFKFWDNFIQYWKKHAVNGVISDFDIKKDEL